MSCEDAARSDRAALARVASAVGAALIPLPLLLVVDVYALRTLHAVLSTFLPEGLTLYLVGGQALMLACLFAFAYGSIPLLAERQRRALGEASHG